jgi:hypothetical protein
MFVLRFWPVAAMTLLGTMLPYAADAQPLPRADLSADEARTLFVDAGYQVDTLRNWDWLSPAVSTFQVHDLERGRVVLVGVYPDVAQAQRASRQLVAGYSASTWIDNLAMFEATSDEYEREMADAAGRSTGMQPELTTQVAAATSAATRVDMEYTAVVLGTQETEE